MGCAASRFDLRNENLDDFNTLSVSYIGGQGRYLPLDFCPVDKLFLNYNSLKSDL